MFKNCVLYRIPAMNSPLLYQMTGVDFPAFTPCGASQDKSSGWVNPIHTDIDSPVAHFLDSARSQLLAYKTETKVVPTSAVKARVKELSQAIARDTGHLVGKKKAKELAEQARFELLPRAFSAEETTLVWLDTSCGWLVIDTPSAKRAAEIVTALVRLIPHFVVTPVQAQQSPPMFMGDCLTSAGHCTGHVFYLGRSAELHHIDGGQRAKVRHTNRPLDTPEVLAQLNAGYTPKQLELDWCARMYFVLTDAWTLRNVRLLDVVVGEHATAGDAQAEPANAAEARIADAVLMTTELRRMLADLLDVMGGELVPGIAPKA